MTNYLQQIITLFKNKILNAGGVERTLYEYINDGDIGRAISLMQDRDTDVDEAITQYNPELHKINKRPDKGRKSRDPYVTVKLPRGRQGYINEVERFFLLGKPIIWKKKEGDDEAFQLFNDFLEDQFYHDNLCELKRKAGSETEAAKLYHVYQDNGEIRVKTVILARSEGYKLRPMFDQYNNLQAFAYGYQLYENGKTIQHWDIETADFLFFCKKRSIGWDVKTYPNPTGKINVIYAQQRVAWHGVQKRCDREEELDSKEGDSNNYTSDPIAVASADVIENMVDPDTSGKLIQLTGANSVFKYVDPPHSSESRESERKNLKESILFDTYTPDLSYDNLKGLGSLSGVAIKNAMAIGYIKRDMNIGYYKQLIRRDYNVIVELLCLLHPTKADAIRAMKVSFEFAEPFEEDNSAKQKQIIALYNAGLISLEEAVRQLSICDDINGEIERIKASVENTNSEKSNNANSEIPDKTPLETKNKGKIGQ